MPGSLERAPRSSQSCCGLLGGELQTEDLHLCPGETHSSRLVCTTAGFQTTILHSLPSQHPARVTRGLGRGTWGEESAGVGRTAGVEQAPQHSSTCWSWARRALWSSETWAECWGLGVKCKPRADGPWEEARHSRPREGPCRTITLIPNFSPEGSVWHCWVTMSHRNDTHPVPTWARTAAVSREKVGAGDALSLPPGPSSQPQAQRAGKKMVKAQKGGVPGELLGRGLGGF